MNEIEKGYDSLAEEMCGKVLEAVKLLQEAKEIAIKAGIQLRFYDDWSELREIIGDFISPQNNGWDSSSWCAEG